MEITYKQEILRKLIHLSSLWMVAAIYFLPKYMSSSLFFSLFLLNILLEYGAYRKWTLFYKVYHTLFHKMLRDKERKNKFHFSGAPYVLAAAFLSSLLFHKEIAMVALSIMLLSDTAAALVGRKWGKHKINEKTKSLEGALAFYSVGVFTLLFYALFFSFTPSLVFGGLIGIILATFAEIYENKIHIDDNLSIPLICGLCLTIMI